jgi:hypothetical protein
MLLGLLLRVHSLMKYLPSRSVRIAAARILLLGLLVGFVVGMLLPLNESIVVHILVGLFLGGAGAAAFIVAWGFLKFVRFALRG